MAALASFFVAWGSHDLLSYLGSRLRRRTRSAHVFKREGCLYQGVGGRGCTLGVSKRRILSFGRSPVLEL